jgi:hypothetical protein
MCMIFIFGTQVFTYLFHQSGSSFSYQWLSHHSTLDIIEVDTLGADGGRLKHWDCTLMFDVAGLEGQHYIIQYVKPNALAKDLELMMECIMSGYPKQCTMRFPEVYSDEMMWDTLKSAMCKACVEQGSTLLRPQPPLPKPSNNAFIS